MKVSEKIIERLRHNRIPFFANDNVSDWILPGELEELKSEVESNVHALLSSLVIDVDNDL